MKLTSDWNYAQIKFKVVTNQMDGWMLGLEAGPVGIIF